MQAATFEEPHGPRSQIGRYRLLATIGHGGMADVYLASAPGSLGAHKLLVVKQLRREQEDERELVTMFLDEARIAVRLAHPNVVQTYEADVDDGLPFIAMEYLEGQPLHRVQRRFAEHGGLPRDTRLWILGELLQGLHHAHELRDYDGRPLRVVHRDVNPQNVFVTYHGVVKLVDFGIAKAMDSASRTDVGMFKGKLSYMAPEQVHGRVDVDRRVDVFAVGVMMWEALVGRRMWHDRPDLEVATALSRAELPRLPAGVDVPPPLRAICERALQYDPALRWPDAAAMNDALQGWLRERGEIPDRAAFGRELEARFASERARRAELIQRYLHGAGPSTTINEPLVDDASVSDSRGDEDETRRVTPPPSTRHLRAPEKPSERPTEKHTTPAEAPPAPPVEAAPSRPWPVTSAVVASAVVVGAVVAGAVVAGAALWAASRSEPAAPSDDRLPSGVTSSTKPSRASADERGAATPPGCVDEGEPVVLTGDIDRDATLTCDRIYLLTYETRVRPGVVLTIEAGTKILGDTDSKGTLIVEPGARLLAEGRPDAPIVLTSAKPPQERQPGDWGGLLVLGRAPINLRDHAGHPLTGQVEGVTRSERFGGNDPDDDSGVLRYLRIEYSGIELAPNNEINGLTLAGVGRGTRLDHVQVRHAADDCFELFGGTVDGDHLVCDDPGDDGFDWDLGYQGHLRFLVVRSTSPERGQHGIEGDNDPQGSDAEPRSRPHLSNVTLCGAGGGDRRGLLLRRGTAARVERALVLGYDAAVGVHDRETSFEIVDSILGGPGGVMAAPRDDQGSDVAALLQQPAWHNSVQAPGLPSCQGPGPEGLRPAAPLPIQGPANPPGDAYIGAFRASDDRWDEPWAVWSSPQ